jgi:tellurite resistance protein TehA-like permease
MAFVLFRRRSPADLVVGWLLVGAGVFTLTFFVISLACDYRYLYLLDLAAMTGAFQVALGSQSRLGRSDDDTGGSAADAAAA